MTFVWPHITFFMFYFPRTLRLGGSDLDWANSSRSIMYDTLHWNSPGYTTDSRQLLEISKNEGSLQRLNKLTNRAYNWLQSNSCDWWHLRRLSLNWVTQVLESWKDFIFSKNPNIDLPCLCMVSVVSRVRVSPWQWDSLDHHSGSQPVRISTWSQSYWYWLSLLLPSPLRSQPLLPLSLLDSVCLVEHQAVRSVRGRHHLRRYRDHQVLQVL